MLYFCIPVADDQKGILMETDYNETRMSVQLNKEGYIQELFYYGPSNIFKDNVFSLCGVHEKYLNNLAMRHDKSTILCIKT